MKILISAIFCICFTGLIPLTGQEKTGILTVYGEARLNIYPDEVVASFHMESKDMEYQRSLNHLGEKSDQLAKTLKKLGYSNEDLKTTQFNITKNYVYTNGARRDSGYVATQIFQLKFPYDSEAIIKMVNAVSVSPIDPELSFSFQLSEGKLAQVKENLISNAVRDAHQKADIITEASMTEIKGIKEIKYGNLSGPEPPMYRMMETAAVGEPAYGGFNVQELIFTESIEITYFIE